MKVKVNEDASVSQATGPDVEVKAGTVEVTEKNRAALNLLVELGLAEPVKSGRGE